ncbi:hypothetical protein FBQ97_11295 [Acidobacteria bacterium ACD]|nr:MAG: hypothetical protein EDX89_13135 [Acidobacteriota bacterium]MDL1950384.1 hypothetical protein [Acidobacteria bacterium ACD]
MRHSRSYAHLLALATLLSACAGNPGAVPASRAAAGRSGSLSFRAESGGEPVAGALVLLAHGRTAEPLGWTNDDGEFSLPKERLARLKGSALLFCWDERNLGCGAVRLDTGRAGEFDWLNVEMPRKKLHDPASVTRRLDHLDRKE